MRISFTAAAVLLALYAAPALADRDPLSGAPKPPKKHAERQPDHRSLLHPRLLLRSAAATPTCGSTRPIRARPGRHGLQCRERPGTAGQAAQGTGGVHVPAARPQQGARRLLRGRPLRQQGAQPGHHLQQPDLRRRAGAQSTFDWRQFDITYTYSFIRNDRFEVGSGIGIYFLQVERDDAAGHRSRCSGARRSPPRRHFRRCRWI